MPELPGMQTVIINTSGERKYFDFLPQAGSYMDIDEEREIFGEIYDWIRQGYEHRVSLKHAIDNGWLTIKTGPGPLVYDATAEETVEIGVDSGSIDIIEPPTYLTNLVTSTTTTTAPTTTT